MISVLIFFGGICQYIVGIMEFVSGNTFGATVFTSYGAFNVSYAMIYLPGSGIIAAYTDAKTGALSPDFSQSLAIYLWAWFILTVIFTVAASRSSWVLFLDLLALDICLMLLAVGFMVENTQVMNAGYAFGYIVAILSCESACSLTGRAPIADGRSLLQTGLVARAYTPVAPLVSKSLYFPCTRTRDVNRSDQVFTPGWRRECDGKVCFSKGRRSEVNQILGQGH